MMAIIDDDDSGNFIVGTPQDDIINGNAGHDDLYGNAGDDQLDGGIGDDLLSGDLGADSMTGGDGDDFFEWIYPDDVLADGGAGNDRAWVYLREATTAYTFDLSDPTVAKTSNGLTLVSLEGLWFDLGSGDDVVTGTPLFDLLWGWLGNDTLRSDPGLIGDFLSGGGGADTLIGGPGPDTLDMDGQDKLIDGGAGDDLLQYVARDLTKGVTISLATPWIAQTVNGTIIRNMDELSFGGSEGDDHVTGGKLSDSISGHLGDDLLRGLGGNDGLNGGPGSDRLIGGSGDDGLRGDEGDDTLEGGAFNDHLFGGVGNDVLYGGAGNDTLSEVDFRDDGTDTNLMDGGLDEDTMTGGLGIDRMFGGGGHDVMRGGGNADELDGGADIDTLFGDAGNDILVGGGVSNDTLRGGTGKDILTGGAGSDFFVFGAMESRTGGGARDIITDFEQGLDLIDLRPIGGIAFEQLVFQQIGSGLLVFADVDGDGADFDQDFGLQLTGIATLDANDFILA